MNTPYDFKDVGLERMVYVRPVDMDDLPDEVRDQAPDVKQLYAVHSATGERLALVADRNMAFILARQNDFAPVNVH